ncbi:hypothetical protein ABID65_008228 [Bradyrhizobium sp. S3.9.2]|uniref:hypothetical protein n=1 Tax=Bradyrhizobium sp. S3.9.2 TaxID=3156432 RepID=UPI00339651F4
MKRRFTYIDVSSAQAVKALSVWNGEDGMDSVERIFIGTAVAGFLVMLAAIVWMMIT